MYYYSTFSHRDSKLTKLLADSLAGNGVTLMVRKNTRMILMKKTMMMMNIFFPLIELTYCFAEL